MGSDSIDGQSIALLAHQSSLTPLILLPPKSGYMTLSGADVKAAIVYMVSVSQWPYISSFCHPVWQAGFQPAVFLSA